MLLQPKFKQYPHADYRRDYRTMPDFADRLNKAVHFIVGDEVRRGHLGFSVERDRVPKIMFATEDFDREVSVRVDTALKGAISGYDSDDDKSEWSYRYIKHMLDAHRIFMRANKDTPASEND